MTGLTKHFLGSNLDNHVREEKAIACLAINCGRNLLCIMSGQICSDDVADPGSLICQVLMSATLTDISRWQSWIYLVIGAYLPWNYPGYGSVYLNCAYKFLHYKMIPHAVNFVNEVKHSTLETKTSIVLNYECHVSIVTPHHNHSH